MSLKPCKECGEQVSSKADKCPNCGVNDPTTKMINKFWIGLFNISILFFFGWLIFGGDGEVNSNADGFSTLSLNVREAPSTDHSVVTALEKGEQVRFLDDSLGWKKVVLVERDGYVTGWASGKYLKDINQYSSWNDKQEEKQQEQEKQQQGYQINKSGAWVYMQGFVKDRLKAPSTAEFPWSSSDRVTYIGNRTYSVKGYVDSENSFGAKIRTRFSGTIRDDGDSWTLIDLNMD